MTSPLGVGMGLTPVTEERSWAGPNVGSGKVDSICEWPPSRTPRHYFLISTQPKITTTGKGTTSTTPS